MVVGGVVGTGDRLGYTVHGNEVNLAARLEQLKKDYGTGIIVSESTRELAGRHCSPGVCSGDCEGLPTCRSHPLAKRPVEKSRLTKKLDLERTPGFRL